MQVIQSKKYGSIPALGEIWEILTENCIDIDYQKFSKTINGNEEELHIGIRALLYEGRSADKYGFMVDTLLSPGNHRFVHIVNFLAEANEIAAEIKENILAYIAAPAAATPEVDAPLLTGKYIKGKKAAAAHLASNKERFSKTA